MAADGPAIVLAKVGNRLVIGNKPASEPHHFDVAYGLSLEPPARLDPIEVAVNVELQQHRRMIRRPTGRLGVDPAEPKIAQIELVDKDGDHPNGIVLNNPIFQAFRKQRALSSIHPFNEALHPIPRKPREESYRANQMTRACFYTTRAPDPTSTKHCVSRVHRTQLND